MVLTCLITTHESTHIQINQWITEIWKRSRIYQTTLIMGKNEGDLKRGKKIYVFWRMEEWL